MNQTHLIIQIIVDNESWILPYAKQLMNLLLADEHDVTLIRQQSDINLGDILFILGCVKRIPANLLKLHTHNLVVHESNLPQGRGNSPLTWQILEGKNEISTCLFEAVAEIDQGPIYLRNIIKLKGNELLPTLKQTQGINSVKLCHKFICSYPDIIKTACPQPNEKSGFYRKRTPKDSQLDVNKTISEQFNLLRVVHNEHYPAFFEINGTKYKLKIDYFNEKT